MGWAVNNFTIRGEIDIIMEGIGDTQNSNGDMVVDRDGDNKTDCR